MKIKIDLHTHTIASGHAYSTLKENIDAAMAEGMEVLGISEHAMMLPGSPDEIYFHNFKVIPERVGDLEILNGIEANIYNTKGMIDVDEALAEKLDYVIASLHSHCYEDAGVVKNTEAVLAAMRNPWVKIIGHPDDDRFPVDRKTLAAAAADNGIALELNNGTLHPKARRQGGKENILELLDVCKQYKTMLIVGSDSHICYEIGHLERAEAMLEQTDFPEEQLVNRSRKALNAVLNPKKHIL